MLLRPQLMIWLGCLFTLPVFATVEPVNVSATTVKETTKTLSHAAQAPRVRVGLSQEVFFQPDYARGEHQTEQVFSGSFSGSLKGSKISGAFKGNGAVGLRNPKTYWYVYAPEAYLETEEQLISKETKLSLGRKLVNWSILDEEWDLGVWQPRFRWNHLTPEQQGLTGIFLENNPTPRLQFQAFASMLYLPEQGAGYTFSEGQFLSGGSQYFMYPQNSGQLLGQNTPFQYSINRPRLTEVLFQPSLALKSTIGDRSSGSAFSLGYANKPVNSLAIEAIPSLFLTGFASIELQPLIYRHELVTAEFRHKFATTTAWTGVTREFVSMSDPNFERVTQRFGDTTLAAVGIEQDFSRFVPEVPTHAGISYLNRHGGDAADVGELANASAPLFASRYPFKSALLFKMKNQIARRLSVQSKTWFDLQNESKALSLYAEYRWTEKLSVGIGGEILTAPSTSPRTGFDTDMISSFRANDRIFTGLAYVY